MTIFIAFKSINLCILFYFCISNVNYHDYHKPYLVYFSQFLLQYYVTNFSKNLKFEKVFMILAIFLRNKCKIRDLLPIFFFAFFASFSLQRIFFAKIFFVCKDSSFAAQYSRQVTDKNIYAQAFYSDWLYLKNFENSSNITN